MNIAQKQTLIQTGETCLWNWGSILDLPFGGPRGRFSPPAAPSISVYWSKLFSSDRVSTCPGWSCARSHGSLSGESPSLGAPALRGWWLSPRVVARVTLPVLGWNRTFFLAPFIYAIGIKALRDSFPASRRKTSCLTDHSRAPQPSPISLDSNQANDLTN